MSNLDQKTVVELRALAARLQIEGRSKLRKQQLIEAILQVQQPQDARQRRATTHTPQAAALLGHQDTQEIPAEPSMPQPPALPPSLDLDEEALEDDEEALEADALEQDDEALEALEVARSQEDEAPQTQGGEALEAAPEPEPERHPFEGVAPLLAPLELGGIPVGYDRDHLSLMVQSPHTLFCYWSLRQHEAHVMEAWHVELRILDVTQGEPVLVRGERVDPRAGRWFLYGMRPDRRYQAQLGAVHHGQFEPRLTSAAVATPPDAPSPVLDTHFVRVSLQDPSLTPAAVSPQEAMRARRGGLQVSPATRGHQPGRRAGAMERAWASQVPLGDSPQASPAPPWVNAAPRPAPTTAPEEAPWGDSGAGHLSAWTTSP